MTRTFLLGLIAGLAVGAAMGLLLAPMSGADVRRRMADAGVPSRDRIGGIASRVRSRVRVRGDVIRQAI
jgi:gas vesicle protein